MIFEEKNHACSTCWFLLLVSDLNLFQTKQAQNGFFLSSYQWLFVPTARVRTGTMRKKTNALIGFSYLPANLTHYLMVPRRINF